MKNERTKNATRNILFGLLLKGYQIIIPFFMRTAIIYLMGVQYLGLNSLFTSVLQILNMAELGVGSAIAYSMYRPIAEDDTEKICSLMKLYQIYYRIIGLIIALGGMILLPFIPHLITGDIPSELNIYILYLLNLATTVLSYWLFAYKNVLLSAHQRSDIISKISLFITTIQYLIQIAVLYYWKNYYFYLVISLLSGVLLNILTAIYTNKTYPNYHPTGKIDYEETKKINQKVRDLFTSKVGFVITDSVDTIVISAFLGLSVLAVYQNYFFILSSIVGFITVILSSCTAGIGNSLVLETKEKNYADLKKITFIISWIAGFCTVALLCLYQPFMEIWIGKDLILDFKVVICFCIYFFVLIINRILNLYKDAAGIWHEDRFRPLVTALSNLAMNLLMVRHWEIYGVILSTVLSTVFIGMPWLLNNLFTALFEKNQMKNYLKNLLCYIIVVIFSCIVTYSVCSLIVLPVWPTFFVRLIICFIFPNIIFLIIYQNHPEFYWSLELVDKITNGKFKIIKNISNYSA